MMSSYIIILIETKSEYWGLKGNQDKMIVNEFTWSQCAWNWV